MRAYSYTGNAFVNTAYIDGGGEAVSVAVGLDGTVFTANSKKGMFAYTYSVAVGISDAFPSTQDHFSLSQNYPNPFNPSTKINYAVNKPTLVSMIVYDILGKEIYVLVDGYQNAGEYTIDFDATGLASGVYYYTLQVDNMVTKTKSMVFLR